MPALNSRGGICQYGDFGRWSERVGMLGNVLPYDYYVLGFGVWVWHVVRINVPS